MIVSRITSKAQTTRLRAILIRAGAAVDDPSASFSEWSNEKDARAFADF